MGLFARLKHALHSARRIELFIMAALIAVAGLMCMRGLEGSSGTGIEKRLEDALGYIEGVGDVEVVVNEDGSGGIVGVLVVAQGASDMRTYIAIQNSVMTLLGTDISMIEIVEMEGRK